MTKANDHSKGEAAARGRTFAPSWAAWAACATCAALAVGCGSSDDAPDNTSIDASSPIDSSLDSTVPLADANGGNDANGPDTSVPGDAGGDVSVADAGPDVNVAACTTIVYTAAASVTVGDSPNWPVLADFNGDSKLDLAVANYGAHSVSVALGNGDGTFKTSQPYQVGLNPLYVAVGDFNGDKKLDLVDTDYTDGTISLLLGNGDGTFQDRTTKPTLSLGAGSEPWGIAVADFDGDGKADLACASYANSDFSIFLGNGDGTFQAAKTSINLGAEPNGIAAGNLTGSGHVDVALAMNSDKHGVAAILLGNGDGTFKQAGIPSTDQGPQTLTIADLDGDGKQDVAVVNQGGGDVAVLLGEGDGGFQGSLLFPIGPNPQGVVVLDANGDHVLDIASPNQETNEAGTNVVSILLGGDGGSFGQPISFDVGTGPVGAASGDLNGDHRPDLVVANKTLGGVSVLLDGCSP